MLINHIKRYFQVAPAALKNRLHKWIRPEADIDRRVRWRGAVNEDEASIALAARAKRTIKSGEHVLVLGGRDSVKKKLCSRLEGMKIPYKIWSIEELERCLDVKDQTIGIVLCAYKDARRQTIAAKMIANSPLALVPFENVPGLDIASEVFRKLDEYADTEFVSPVILDDPTPYDIYQESLTYFEQKCGLRDYLDLYQLLKSVVKNEVSGDVAEFGSYRGHSGWLISRTLEAFGSNKKLYMFDTFQSFPEEELGVDQFWSGTHEVDFESVKSKFANRSNVVMIKGDFTKTLDEVELSELALAYIDCDSYRATHYLLQVLPKSCIARGGVLVCEDYGHPALLGNRVAVHEVCDELPGWFRFFSQFSGHYILINMAN